MLKLQITQPTNPTPDNVFDVSQTRLDKPGPFTLNGVTVSDIHFVEIAMDGTMEEVTYCSNTAAQAGLRLDFCRRRHAVIARAFGISPAQRR